MVVFTAFIVILGILATGLNFHKWNRDGSKIHLFQAGYIAVTTLLLIYGFLVPAAIVMVTGEIISSRLIKRSAG